MFCPAIPKFCITFFSNLRQKKIPGCTAGGKSVCFLRFLTDEAQDQVCHSAAGAAVQVVKELGLKGRYFLALKVTGDDGLCQFSLRKDDLAGHKALKIIIEIPLADVVKQILPEFWKWQYPE